MAAVATAAAAAAAEAAFKYQSGQQSFFSWQLDHSPLLSEMDATHHTDIHILLFRPLHCPFSPTHALEKKKKEKGYSLHCGGWDLGTRHARRIGPINMLKTLFVARWETKVSARKKRSSKKVSLLKCSKSVHLFSLFFSSWGKRKEQSNLGKAIPLNFMENGHPTKYLI